MITLLAGASVAQAQNCTDPINGVQVHPEGGVTDPAPIGNMPVGELLDNVKHIRVGFTLYQVTAWIGRPARLDRTIDADKIVDRWLYETANLDDGQWRVRSATITFKEGRVVAINYEKSGARIPSLAR